MASPQAPRPPTLLALALLAGASGLLALPPSAGDAFGPYLPPESLSAAGSGLASVDLGLGYAVLGTGADGELVDPMGFLSLFASTFPTGLSGAIQYGAAVSLWTAVVDGLYCCEHPPPVGNCPNGPSHCVLLFGGDGGSGPTDDVYLFDVLATGTLPAPTPVATLPSDLAHHAAFYVPPFVYVIGGRTGTAASTATDDIQRFEPQTNTFLPFPLSLPAAVADAAAVQVGEAIYLLGGTDASGSAVADVVRFVPASGSAQVVATLPYAVTNARAAYDGANIFLFGGASEDRILKFDPDTGTGTVMSVTLPSDLEGMAVHYLMQSRAPRTGSFVVMGGWDGGAAAAVDDVAYYRAVPEAPGSLAATLTGTPGGVSLAWTAPGSDTYSELGDYQVWRYDDPPDFPLPPDADYPAVPSSPFTDQALPGHTYHYYVRAWDRNEGEGEWAGPVSITT